MHKNHRKNHRTLALSLGSFFILFSTLSSVTSAQAGFQWVAPEPAPAVAPAPLSPPPVLGSESPIIISGTMPAFSGEPQIITGSPSADVVQGFADQVPLSVALRQILPADTGFSVAQDVSMGSLVSWQGGAPWRTVMTDMLDPHGLTIREEGKLVHIIHKPKDAVVASAQARPSLPPLTSMPPASLADGAPVSLSPISTPDYALPPEPVMAPVPKASVPETPSVRYAPQLQGYSSSVPQPLGYLPSAAERPQPITFMDSGHVGAGVETWQAQKGQMLRDVLTDWSRRANVDLSWQAQYDYPFQASVTLNGTFEEAVRHLLAGFQDAEPKPTGHLYNNQLAGQRVLVVQVLGGN